MWNSLNTVKCELQPLKAEYSNLGTQWKLICKASGGANIQNSKCSVHIHLEYCMPLQTECFVVMWKKKNKLETRIQIHRM